MPNGINPYVHTSSILNPQMGNRLYADEPHQQLMGISNLFTNTPTINKYVHSPESLIDIANLPALEMKPSIESGILSKEKSGSDNQTINKRLLSSESLFDLHAIPCPFIESFVKETESPSEADHIGRRRMMSVESRHDLDRIPDPFGLKAGEQDLRQQQDSCYAFKTPKEEVRSYYCMDYNQQPHAQSRNFATETTPKGGQDTTAFHHTPRPQFMLPSSAYDYTHYSLPYRTQPFQSDYDYTAYSRPMMPPPFYAPFMPCPYAPPPYCHQFNPPYNPYYPQPSHSPQPHHHHQPYNQDRKTSHAPCHHPPPHSCHHHQAPIPMYNLGLPYNLTYPMNVPFSAPLLDFTRVDSHAERNSDQAQINSSQQAQSYDATPPNNARIRDFSIDSMKDLNAIPSFSAQSLANEPSRNVFTAQIPTVLDFGEQEQPA